MKYLIFFLSFPALAEPYVDLSLEVHDKQRDSFWQKDGVPIDNTIGSIELGYEYKNYSIFLKHSSSTQQRDSGLNTLGIKVRIK